jgi:uncharacterized protein YuzE
MQIVYDKEADCVYIYLDQRMGARSARTVPFEISATTPMVLMDLDSDNKIIGFEIQDAKNFLPKSFLDNADVSE